MNEYQKLMLDITKSFIKVCDDLSIEWWSAGGTMLGAVRHRGFIPWDTDIDLYIRRSDYEHFKNNPEIFFPYKLEEFYGFLKLYDENTTGYAGWWKKGISIDIFALDEDGKELGDYRHQNSKWHYPKEDFDGYDSAQFEDIKIRLPLNYIKHLENEYGDWKIPNKEGGDHSNVDCYFSLKKEWNDMVVVGIPVYHSRETLPRALDSLVLQTKQMFMVMIVNDADGEDYSDILKEYRNKGLKITYVVQEKNMGPGLARQRVIDSCPMCEYIMFLDSDDMYSPIAIEVMTRAISQSGLDIVMGNSTQLITGKPAIRAHLESTSITWVWNKIYRRQYLIDNNLRFPTDLKVSEDIAFSLAAWNITNKKTRLEQDIYYWCDNKNSLTRIEGKTEFDRKNIADFVKAQVYGLEKIIENNVEISQGLFTPTLKNIYTQIQTANALGSSEDEYIDVLKRLNDFETMNYFKQTFESWAYIVNTCPVGIVTENNDVIFFKERFVDWFNRIFTD